MKPDRLIELMERFAAILPVVVGDVSEKDARWKPPDGAWSILEIVSHLADEEVDDFRSRLEMTLRNTNEPWRPNDPEQWAIDRKYNEGNQKDVLSRFLAERKESIHWLRSLATPDWSVSYDHPSGRTIQAGDLFVSWAAHDWLHLRQISKRMYQLAQRDASDYSADYAGAWTA